jgi:hypothetical protein
MSADFPVMLGFDPNARMRKVAHGQSIRAVSDPRVEPEDDGGVVLS